MKCNADIEYPLAVSWTVCTQCSWTKIAKLLPGRSENAVKNRWNSAARKKGKTESQNNAADLAKVGKIALLSSLPALSRARVLLMSR